MQNLTHKFCAQKKVIMFIFRELTFKLHFKLLLANFYVITKER